MIERHSLERSVLADGVSKVATDRLGITAANVLRGKRTRERPSRQRRIGGARSIESINEPEEIERLDLVRQQRVPGIRVESAHCFGDDLQPGNAAVVGRSRIPAAKSNLLLDSTARVHSKL